MENAKQKLHKISCFVFDVDGVLTNGSLILLPTGEQVRTMNIRDGYAMQLAIKQGYRIIVISGGKSEAVTMRLNTLGITDVYLGNDTKEKTLTELMNKYGLMAEHVLYMGDDIPDISAMKLCGLPTCPADAAPEIKELALYISDKKGGNGCVRDIIEQTLRLHGKWLV
jgi:3-deoxy-D-manno-octulosonate 8-phosphate phosphatase (KDO 8-P phosphatase)